MIHFECTSVLIALSVTLYLAESTFNYLNKSHHNHLIYETRGWLFIICSLLSPCFSIHRCTYTCTHVLFIRYIRAPSFTSFAREWVDFYSFDSGSKIINYRRPPRIQWPDNCLPNSAGNSKLIQAGKVRGKKEWKKGFVRELEVEPEDRGWAKVSEIFRALEGLDFVFCLLCVKVYYLRNATDLIPAINLWKANIFTHCCFVARAKKVA